MTDCPYNKGEMRAKTNTQGECHVNEDDGRDGGEASISQGMPKIGQRHETDSPQKPSQETSPANTLLSQFHSPEL